MEAIVNYFSSMNLNFGIFLKATGMLIVALLALAVVGRFIFGKRSALSRAVSSAIGILFIYAITILLGGAGEQFQKFIAPLPFVTIQGDSMVLFNFQADYTVICTQVLSMIILALVSWFIVSNTIKLAMHNRRHEINIMKYVGATNAFIRTPFVLEGIIIGLSAAFISFAGQWIIYVYLLQPLVANLSFVTTVPFSELWPVIAAYFGGIGLLVGLVGSTFSINKYLKV